MTQEKLRVLVLCTGNSCRSQMAEGWLKHLYGGRIEAHSAGSEPSGYVHLKAITAMNEVGVDISDGRSKSVKDFLGLPFDYVLTVCDPAAENCPAFPGRGERVHQNFYDPARALGTDDQVLDAFRRVRDEIRGWLDDIFASELES